MKKISVFYILLFWSQLKIFTEIIFHCHCSWTSTGSQNQNAGQITKLSIESCINILTRKPNNFRNFIISLESLYEVVIIDKNDLCAKYSISVHCGPLNLVKFDFQGHWESKFIHVQKETFSDFSQIRKDITHRVWAPNSEHRIVI